MGMSHYYKAVGMQPEVLAAKFLLLNYYSIN